MGGLLFNRRNWPGFQPSSTVEWITAATTPGLTIAAAIPPVFDAYATVVLPRTREEQPQHDRAVLAVLAHQSPDQSWWLGYLDTGADDIVFPEAAKVTMYADWRYVLVQAGPAQAGTWRQGDVRTSFWWGQLPNVIFPQEKSWLISTLWDDDWTCVGGPATLIDCFLSDPVLGPRARRVAIGMDATPPGRSAI